MVKSSDMETYKGPSGEIEDDTNIEIFLRSNEKSGEIYDNSIADWDPKMFKAILEKNP